MNNRLRPRRGKPIRDYKNISQAAETAFQAAAPRPEPGNGKEEPHRYSGASAGMLSAISGRLGLVERQMQAIKETIDRIEQRLNAPDKHLEAIRKAIIDMTEAVGALGKHESW
jgi:enamine deaminase RidA (YjgF/YER057c/UK114 family)